MPKSPDAPATLWRMHECAFAGPSEGNPYLEVTLAAEFRQGDRIIRVNGFYDGGGVYRLRFMPESEGQWRYETTSSAPAPDIWA